MLPVKSIQTLIFQSKNKLRNESHDFFCRRQEVNQNQRIKNDRTVQFQSHSSNRWNKLYDEYKYLFGLSVHRIEKHPVTVLYKIDHPKLESMDIHRNCLSFLLLDF